MNPASIFHLEMDNHIADVGLQKAVIGDRPVGSKGVLKCSTWFFNIARGY
jgi:hypothetical protein